MAALRPAAARSLLRCLCGEWPVAFAVHRRSGPVRGERRPRRLLLTLERLEKQHLETISHGRALAPILRSELTTASARWKQALLVEEIRALGRWNGAPGHDRHGRGRILRAALDELVGIAQI